MATVEAGDEDHAEAVEVAVGGAAPLVLDLGCWQASQATQFSISIFTNIVQVGLGSLTIPHPTLPFGRKYKIL